MRRSRGRGAAGLALGGTLLVLAAGSCREPTQVTLDLSYNGSCSDLQGWGVAIIVGNDPFATEARVQSDFFTATTDTCVGGHIGTLVLTPSEASQRGSVIVIAGLGRKPQECDPENGYFGCVVARRAFSFAEHTRLVMPIVLDPSCKNVPCNAVSTCKSGACVSSEAQCEGSTCADFGIASDGGTAFIDAPTSSDALVPTDDGAAPTDAGSEASTDASSDGGACAKEPLTCPLGGATCEPNGVCCIRPPPTQSNPQPVRTKSCDPALGGCGNPYDDVNIGGPNLVCRGARNCPDPKHWCCAPPAPVTQCAEACVYGPPGSTPSIVCMVDCECPVGMFCDKTTPYLGELFKCKPR